MANISRYTKSTAITTIALTLLIAGCGGGGSSSEDSSSESTSVVSRGMVTGFGSVYVNGVRFRTDDTRFDIDDSEGSESDLRVGMIVTVKGSHDGRTSRARSITYDNELKGPVTAITPDAADPGRKTLTILGQSVLVTTDTTIDDDGGLTFDSIALNDVLEVSGFITASGFTATHIELQDDDHEIEIRGRIENLTPGSFSVRGFPVSYDGSTPLDDIATLVEGLYVEVEGMLDMAGTTLLALKIEGEHEGLDDDMDEAEIVGVISDYDAGSRTFMLQGQVVDASNAELEPHSLVLADGLTVEAEGRISAGVLLAREVELEGGKVKIHATLSAVDAAAGTVSFTFNATDITIRVHSGTEIEDGNSGNDLLLSDLSAGHFVELKAYADTPGVINAVEIKRVDPDEVRIDAAVQSFDDASASVVMLGVEFDLSAATFEDDDDNSISAIAFFDALAEGVFIEIEDSDANGVFDKAELDD